MAASTLSELSGWAHELLDQAPVARLGLLDEHGHPRVLPVTFALAADQIWSAVDQKPKRAQGPELARVRWLRRDPRAALTVDRYSEDWRELAWVQVLGSVAIVPAERGPEGLGALVERYPQYRATPPPGPLLALEPVRCLCWRASEGR